MSKLQSSQSYQLTNWLFLRSLAVIYFIAFWSLGSQVLGLIGSEGIIPLAEHMQVMSERIGALRYRLFPTLAWISSSDGFISFLCWGGALLSILLFLNIAPQVMTVLLWLFYLSLTTACREFLGFQWDNLLLETGLLAIFLAPKHFGFKFKDNYRPSIIMIWLVRWLIFRLMFESGVVKIASEDPNWRNLEAMSYHWLTTCLPHRVNWFVHQLPMWFDKFTCVSVFIIELIIPLLVFFRRGRLIAFICFVGLQVVIVSTGNYGWFNLLTAVICIPLLDDDFLKKVLPSKWKEGFHPNTQKRKWPHYIFIGLVLLYVVPITSAQLYQVMARKRVFKPLQSWMSWVSPFRSANRYGLFATMTTDRREIEIEGSHDGQEWKVYEFKWKPGDLDRAPVWAHAHMPRLDWQMWFAALSNYKRQPWLLHTMAGLLEGSEKVEGLFKTNPFPDAPPKFMRAVIYDYHFTTIQERKETGAWWKREYLGLYTPVMQYREEK